MTYLACPINIHASTSKIEVYDRTVAYFWLDEDGILNIKSKDAPRDYETVKANGLFLKDLLKGKKVPCLYDITMARPLEKEERELVKQELPELHSAVAMITRSQMGNMLASVFTVITPPEIPTKMFVEVSEARQWALQFR